MNELKLEDLLKEINKYNKRNKDIIKKAYFYAEKFHEGQKRQSGEEYIIHPLNVAYILATMKADEKTVCAGLLHDVLEDTPVTKEELTAEFGEEVCNLVLGVTKISNIHFVNEEDIIMENTRKIITSIKNDIRIIVIKLADRLHNMKTLEFKKPEKQVKNAVETMEIFIPLAYHIGAYLIKEELEDLSFKYLDKEKYKKIKDLKNESFEKNAENIELITNTIGNKLKAEKIKFKLVIRELSLTGINKRLNKGYKFEEIHNIRSLVVTVPTIMDCYKALGTIHSVYYPVNHKFKDYISNPKTNMYKSLHTTIFGMDGYLMQVQIRTFEMDMTDCYGLVSYWERNKNKATNLMQKDLIENYQFFSVLEDLDNAFGDNYQFVNLVKDEVLNDKIYVYSPSGEIVELPKGSTPIDFAFKMHTEIGTKMVSAVVNDHPVDIDYVLKNKDRIKIVTDDSNIDKKEWIEKAHTSYAKRKIKESLKVKEKEEKKKESLND